jgi:hypothetical protein
VTSGKELTINACIGPPTNPKIMAKLKLTKTYAKTLSFQLIKIANKGIDKRERAIEARKRTTSRKTQNENIINLKRN